jgi:hypothetical protein
MIDVFGASSISTSLAGVITKAASPEPPAGRLRCGGAGLWDRAVVTVVELNVTWRKSG